MCPAARRGRRRRSRCSGSRVGGPTTPAEAGSACPRTCTRRNRSAVWGRARGDREPCLRGWGGGRAAVGAALAGTAATRPSKRRWCFMVAGPATRLPQPPGTPVERAAHPRGRASGMRLAVIMTLCADQARWYHQFFDSTEPVGDLSWNIRSSGLCRWFVHDVAPPRTARLADLRPAHLGLALEEW